MNLLEEKKSAADRGRRQAIKAISVGLGIAYVIMGLVDYPYTSIKRAALWLFYSPLEFQLILYSAVVATYLFGALWGGIAGKAILLKKKSWALVGILSGFAIVWSATFLTSLVGVFQNINDEGVIFDYIFKPMFWVTWIGFIPIIVVGLWFGRSILKTPSLVRVYNADHMEKRL